VLPLLLFMVMMNMIMTSMMMKQRCGSVIRTDLLLHLVLWWRCLKFAISFKFSKNILYRGFFIASDSTVNSLTTGSVRIK
jgi:hypothetical protein